MNRIGTLYGQGLYALAKEEGLEEALLQQLQVLNSCFAQQPEYLKLLASHTLPKQERTALLEEGFRERVHPYVLNFLKLLTEKGYIRQFGSCCRVFQEQYYADKGILEVHAVSAVPLTQEQKQRLTEKLTAITGKQIALVCRETKAVLGGIRLNYDGMQVDGTVQGRLESIGRQLKNTVL